MKTNISLPLPLSHQRSPTLLNPLERLITSGKWGYLYFYYSACAWNQKESLHLWRDQRNQGPIDGNSAYYRRLVCRCSQIKIISEEDNGELMKMMMGETWEGDPDYLIFRLSWWNDEMRQTISASQWLRQLFPFNFSDAALILRIFLGINEDGMREPDNLTPLSSLCDGKCLPKANRRTTERQSSYLWRMFFEERKKTYQEGRERERETVGVNQEKNWSGVDSGDIRDNFQWISLSFLWNRGLGLEVNSILF